MILHKLLKSAPRYSAQTSQTTEICTEILDQTSETIEICTKIILSVNQNLHKESLVRHLRL